MCDTQHRCKLCKGYLHAICGHEYFDDNGDVVEDLAFPRICNKCHESEFRKSFSTPKTKTKRTNNVASAKATVPVDEGSTTEDDASSDDDKEFFGKDELERFHPGFIIVKDLKRGETT